MILYKILSVLLEYPDQEFLDHREEIVDLISTLESATDTDKQVLLEFMAWMESLSLTQFQANYVNTFDLAADNALYLTHHLFDEQDRDRGPTLVNLSEFFKSEGFEIANRELPDYLPLILEYVSGLENEASARLFLQQSSHASEIIAGNLEKTDSPYAPLLRIVERHGRLAEIAA